MSLCHTIFLRIQYIQNVIIFKINTEKKHTKYKANTDPVYNTQRSETNRKCSYTHVSAFDLQKYIIHASYIGRIVRVTCFQANLCITLYKQTAGVPTAHSVPFLLLLLLMMIHARVN